MTPRQSWACFMGFRNCWALFMYFWKCRASLVNFREYRASLVDFRKYRASLVDGSCQEEAKLTPSISSKINALEAGRFRCGRQLACEQSRSTALVCLGDAPRSGSRIVQCRCNRGECADRRAAGISAVLHQGCSPSVLTACTWALAADQWSSVAAVHARMLTTVVEPEVGLIECPFRPQGSGAWYPIAKIRSWPDTAASQGTCPAGAFQLQSRCSRSPRRWSAVSRSRSSQATPPQPLCAR